MGWKQWHDEHAAAGFGQWLQERCFDRRSACASTAAAMLYLREHGLKVSRTTLDHWLHDRRLPDAGHLVMLFEVFSISQAERERVAHLVTMRRAESAGAA